MQRKLPLAISIAALVVTLLGATGPAMAHGVRHALFAHNADKVDGKHAVTASASLTKRRGKLVATSRTTGRLPNNIIAKATDANLLDGLNSTAFLRSNAAAAGDLTGTYPNPAVAAGAVTTGKLADGAVTLPKLAPEVGLGFFTGRVDDLDPSLGGVGAVSGLSQAAGSDQDVWTLSPNQEIRLSELAARLTAVVDPLELVAVEVEAFAPDGTFFGGVGCAIGAGQSECTAAGPSVDTVPPRSLLLLRVSLLPGSSLPPGTDLLFSWRAQAP